MQVASLYDILNSIQRTPGMSMEEYARRVYDLAVRSMIEDIVPPRWSPPPGGWAIFSDGGVEFTETHDPRREFGSERNSKEEAEYASKKMTEHNRLLTYAAEFCPDHEFTEGSRDMNWHVMRVGKQWSITSTQVYVPGIVYMPEDVAYDLARKLNSGEVTLDKMESME
jgi:hypothetical protein